ncbi:redoxin domain-containing protein [Candidatus Woesearchaeota archaeon]|nr:redoxin domain-containing protein [Candidatus Woesearchaeota archaeon]
MKKMTFVKKPFLAAVVVIFAVAAIIYIESKKPDISQAQPQSNPNEQNTKYPRAPDFAGIERWINSEPLKIEQLRDKVVLVDFWTYTCINCIRTLPYLKEWDKKYRDKGLVIVGVHTPEFEFEKKYENVLKAVNDYQLKYAVAQDNNYATWSVYQNRYWPHKFLIDVDGYIRYDHIGEGAYEETEKMIQLLLKERMEKLRQKDGIEAEMSKPTEAIEVNFSSVKTPEIYFGYKFDRGNLGYQNIPPDSIVDFKFPLNPFRNFVYLSGKWKYNADNMELIDDEGEILLVFDAKNVNIVAGSENSSEAFVFLDNEFENKKNKGSDIFIKENKSISSINEFKLYNIASAENYGSHALNINVAGKGFKIYTFTFG